MYTLVTITRYTNDLSIGFDRDRGGRQRELTINKTQKGNIQLRIMLKGVFGFVETQTKLLMSYDVY